MKLYHQLILFIVLATLLPLAVGFWVMLRDQNALQEKLLAAREESAVRLADTLARDVREVLERVHSALGYVSLEQVTNEELTGLLGIVYKQSEDIAQVALLDSAGKPLVAGVFLERPRDFPEYAGRLAISAEAHARFLDSIPLPEARKAPHGTVVLGTARRDAAVGPPLLAIAVPLEIPSKETRWVVVADLSLARLSRQVGDAGEERGWRTLLVDSHDRLIARSGNGGPEPLNFLGDHPAVSRFRAGAERGAYLRDESLVAYARVSVLGWGVILEQASDEALSEIRRTRRLTAGWTLTSLLALLVLGGLFTSRITRNLRRFVQGAQEYSRGNLGARVELRSRDELGLLAKTFNQMGQDLQAYRAEIDLWNQELTRRVEQRTRELEEAHRRLLQTSKLAAIGQLGSGVAHEINNPLVGILGNAQLLQLKWQGPPEQLDALRKIEASAKRCKEIVQNLQRFSEQEEDPEHVECDLRAAILDASMLLEQRLLAQRIAIDVQVSPEMRVLGDHRQLVQVFFNLMANARTAMPGGGTLTVRADRKGDSLEVAVRDTGQGIPPEIRDRIFEPFFTTKAEWTNTGLGLSVVYRIVMDHGGRIELDSEEGKGSTFRVILPLLEERT